MSIWISIVMLRESNFLNAAREEGLMLVMVRYINDNYDLVDDYCLDYLIVTGRIVGHSLDGAWKRVEAQPKSVHEMRRLPGVQVNSGIESKIGR